MNQKINITEEELNEIADKMANGIYEKIKDVIEPCIEDAANQLLKQMLRNETDSGTEET